MTGALTTETLSVSPTLQHDLDRAVEILKAGGCREVYVFGSVASGRVHAQSDLDLAVRGCPPGRFFALMGRLLMQLEHSVDLIDLDSDDPVGHFLVKKGRLKRVA